MLLAMEPTPLKRVFFWGTYVVGTVAFIFGLLLTQVPRSANNKDFTLEFLFWGGCFLLLAISLMLMRTITSSKSRKTEGGPGWSYYFVGVLSAAEMSICVFALLSVLVELIRH
jgi:hypothetical protein